MEGVKRVCVWAMDNIKVVLLLGVAAPRYNNVVRRLP